MIASREKHEDLKAYLDLVAVLERAIALYESTQDSRFLEAINDLEESRKRLKIYIETHDYTYPHVPVLSPEKGVY